MANSIFSDKRLRFFFAAWWAICMLLQFIMLKSIDVDTTHAIIDSIIAICLLAAGCFFISNNMRYYLPRQEKYWYIIITSLAIAGTWLLIIQGIIWLVFKKGDTYPDFVRSTSIIRFGAGFLMTSSISMFSLLWYSQQEQKAWN